MASLSGLFQSTNVTIARISRPFRSFLYAISPRESSFEFESDVPRYITEAIPAFIILIILEQFILWAKGKQLVRINDGIGSITAGILQEVSRILLISVDVCAYVWCYDNLRIMELPWDSHWTWIFSLLWVDFAYYWFHRMSHEVNIFWASHQTHHSSEDYNLTTALRQSVFAQYGSWMFYLPMALFAPPSAFLVHMQLNRLFQFWIHTAAIDSLGPLEYIFNTPSHHRVHHGINPYCIDKNYAGVFIIWDRMFGTFEAEKEEVVYGLVHQISTFAPVYIQIGNYLDLWKRFWQTKGFCNKLSVIFKGPGWTAGQPRLGNPEDIPNVSARDVKKYHPPQPLWCNAYLVVHFALLIVVYQGYAHNNTNLEPLIYFFIPAYVLYSVISFGAILDNKPFASFVESIRCIVVILAKEHVLVPLLTIVPISMSSIFLHTLTSIYSISALIWLYRSMSFFSQKTIKVQ